MNLHITALYLKSAQSNRAVTAISEFDIYLSTYFLHVQLNVRTHLDHWHLNAVSL